MERNERENPLVARKMSMNELRVDYFYMALKSVFSLAVVVEPNVINMMMMCVYKAHSLEENSNIYRFLFAS